MVQVRSGPPTTASPDSPLCVECQPLCDHSYQRSYKRSRKVLVRSLHD